MGPRRRSSTPWEPGRSWSPSPSGLAGIGLILRPFLPSPKSVAVGVVAIACGLLLALAAQTAGLGPEGVRKGLFDPSFFPHHGGGLGEVLYWATTHALPASRRPDHRRGAAAVRAPAAHRALGLGHGPRCPSRRGPGQARHRRLRHRDQGEPGPHGPGPDRHDAPPTPSPSSGRPSRSADGDDFQVLMGGDERAETERVANFDDAVRVADEPDTSELEDLEEEDEAIRVRQGARNPRRGRGRADDGEPEARGPAHSDGREARRRHRVRGDRLRAARRRAGARARRRPTRVPTSRTTRRSRATCSRRSATSGWRRRSSGRSPART